MILIAAKVKKVNEILGLTNSFNKNTKRNLIVAIILSLIALVFGYFSEPDISRVQSGLGITLNVLQIFYHNLTTVTIILIFSLFIPPFGIALALKFLFDIGKFFKSATISFDLQLYKIVLSGITHGIGEFIVMIILVTTGFETGTYWAKYFFSKGKDEPDVYYRRIFYKTKTIFIIAILILLVSAFLEIYISKPMFQSIMKGA